MAKRKETTAKKEPTANIHDVKTSLEDIWAVKYAPKEVSELACTEEIRDLVSHCIENNTLPNHLCLYGTPGTGKNSIVNLFKRNMDVNMLVINASEENGIDDVRSKVMKFVNSGALFNKPKIIVMNEADGLTTQAQNSMRELMEARSESCRFIFTCNSINQIIAPLKSRFSVYLIDPPIKEVCRRLMTVLKTEGVEYTKEFIQKFIKIKGRDLRKLLNDAQALHKYHNVLDVNVFNSNTESYIPFFDSVFATESLKAIGDKVKNQLFEEDVYTVLANYCIDKNFPSLAIPIIADHVYRSAAMYDKDMIFMSCILTIKQLLESKK